MKKTFITSILLLFVYIVSGQTLKWVKQAGSYARVNDGNAIATDAAGNIYVTGRFQGVTNFGGTTLTPAAIDIFVAKYNSAGTLQWVKQAGGSGAFNYGYGIAVDGSGNVYVTGYIAAATDFDGTTVTPVGYNDVFVAKYNSSGSFQWVTNAGAAGKYAIGHGIAVDAVGNAVITGEFQGVTNFGGITLTAIGSKDIFIASYNSAGVLLWVKQGGVSNRSDIGTGIAADKLGNIFVTGELYNNTMLAGTSIGTVGDPDMFIANFNTSGVLQWVRHAGYPSIHNGGLTTSYPVRGVAIATDGSGSLFVTGTFDGAPDFGGTVLSQGVGRDIFTAKYSSTGDLIWVRQIGKLNKFNFTYAIAADTDGNCYVTGSFQLSADFGGTTYNAIGKQDAYVCKYNNIGNLEWVRQAGSTNKFNNGQGVATDASGNVCVIGYFSGPTDFGGTTLNMIGNQDVFIWVIQQNNCLNSLTPTGTITTNQKAAATVITNSTNVIPDASNVIYQGGNFVMLNAGFSAVNGSVFTARIAGNCQ
ncbi:SBBP repeat-containing protein [Emticicia sp. 17c]|uniref:SBBP repeat-containing protein n=1 Tax=Emticicia sp. 17c TaxID=3127704 RepID=UPI00301C8C21